MTGQHFAEFAEKVQSHLKFSKTIKIKGWPTM